MSDNRTQPISEDAERPVVEVYEWVTSRLRSGVEPRSQVQPAMPGGEGTLSPIPSAPNLRSELAKTVRRELLRPVMEHSFEGHAQALAALEQLEHHSEMGRCTSPRTAPPSPDAESVGGW